MGRKADVLLAVALALLGGCGSKPEPTGPVPLVLVSFDTLRADRLNCYGYSARQLSPHIDALARDGILFENHISAAPWTIPSHMSLLTSLWPSNHGVTGSLRELRDDETSYHVLSESRTTLAEVLAAHEYETAAFTGGDTLDPRFGFGQGFARYETAMLKLSRESVDSMLSWLSAHRGQPFFLFWHTFEAHAPYLGTRFLEEVLPREKAASVRDSIERYGAHMRSGEARVDRLEARLRGQQAFTPAVTEALYAGSVADADEWFGRFVDALKRDGVYDRALVVFTSDHGEEFCDRSPKAFYNAHGHSLWREMIRVPLIVKLPRQEAAGTRVTALSRSVDVMPTALDVLGLQGTPEMQGVSLRPLWQQKQPAPRTAYMEALESLEEEKGIQVDRYKYLVRIGAESVLSRGRTHIPATPEWRGLYDVSADPGETRNLLDGTLPTAVANLAERLDRELRDHIAAQRPDSRPVPLDPEAIERLRALGYVR